MTVKLNEAEAKTTLADSDGILVADATARSGDAGAAVSNPKFITKANLTTQLDIPTEAEIDARADARVQAGVADWAEDGNTDEIPTLKLPDIPSEGDIDARVRFGVADWAESNNNDRIPSNKMATTVIRYLGAWAQNQSVGQGDMVIHGGELWVSQVLAGSTNAPASDNSQWKQISGEGSEGGLDSAAVLALIADWAENSNTDNIPDSKLGNVQPVALVSNQARWGTNKLPVNIIYYSASYSATTTYNPGNVVRHSSAVWVLVKATSAVGSEPSASNNDWARIDGGGGGTDTTLFKGNYSSSTNYFRGDIVWDNTNFYVSRGGVSGAPNVGNALTSAVWWQRLVGAQGPQGNQGAAGADGRTPFQGTWASGSTYQQGDYVVDASGEYWIYINATAGNTSATPAEGTSWTQFRGPQGPAGEGGGDSTSGWRGAWATNTAYVSGDIVRVAVGGGTTDVRYFFCRSAHTSNASSKPREGTLAIWSSFWREFGMVSYRGNYDGGGAYYDPGDVVQSGGNLYMSVASFTSVNTPGSNITTPGFHANWVEIQTVKHWRGDWIITAIYDAGQIVRHSSQIWIALSRTGNQGDADEPRAASTVWVQISGGTQGPQGPKGDKGDKGDTGDAGQDGDDGDDGAPGAQGPAGPAGTVPNEPGVPTPGVLIGTTDLPNQGSSGSQGLIINATNWKNYDYLNIIIREDQASNNLRDITARMIDVAQLKTTQAADTTTRSVMQVNEVCMYRGQNTNLSNLYFFIARTATDEDTKLRLAASNQMNRSGATQKIDVWGLRVGYASFKGVYSSSVTYSLGDYVWHSSEFWFVTAETISNSEPTDSNTNYKRLGSGTGTPAVPLADDGTDTTLWKGAWAAGTAYTEGNIVSFTDGERWMCLSDHTASTANAPNAVAQTTWTQISEDYRFALQPRTGTAIGNVRTASVGVHQVGTNTDNLPSGFTPVGNETFLVVWGAQQGTSSEHKLKMLVCVNDDTGGGATLQQLWFQFQDGPGGTASNHSAWHRIDNAINTPALQFTTSNLRFRYKNADGTDQVAQVSIPDSMLGEADYVEVTTSGTTITVTTYDINGDEIQSDSADIVLPVLNQNQWEQTADNPQTYRNQEALISPAKAAAVVDRRRPQGTTALAEGGANTAVYYGWNPRQLHDGAKAALPAVTVASLTSGTNSTIKKSVTESVLKAWGETLGGDGGGDGGGGGGGEGGGETLTLIGTSRQSYTSHRFVPAQGWGDYDEIEARWDDSTSDADTNYHFGVLFRLPVSMINDTSIQHNSAAGSNRDVDFPSEDHFGELRFTYRPDSQASQLSAHTGGVLRASTGPLGASNQIDANRLVLNMSNAGSGSTNQVNRIRLYGVNFASGGGGGGSGPKTQISYAHENAPDQNAAYAPSVIYGSSSDSRATDPTARRKFVVGDILSSSNSNNGLPNATLEFQTGARSGIDNNEGETGSSNLIDGSVYKPGSGTWKHAIDASWDNAEDGDNRMVIELWEVVSTATTDDKLIWSEASEGGGAVGMNHSATTPTAAAIHNFAGTARLETPPIQTDGTKLYYATFRMTGEDDDGAMRFRNLALTLTKET